MKTFLHRHGQRILGVLSCFDRIRFRGTLRSLSHVGGTLNWLSAAGVLLKDFLPFAEQLTQRLRRDTARLAEEAGRPVQYLDRWVDKEDRVAKIRQEQGVAENGLIAVLSTLETCQSYDIYRNRRLGQIELRRRLRKCLHYYFYFLDGRFGLSQVRLMSWFPFDVHIVLNGREWLAQELDRAGIGYRRRDNCFVDIEDFGRAQQLADRQPRIGWPGQLQRLLRRAHPRCGRLPGTPHPVAPLTYYWTSEQTEWATDLAFRDAASLADLYPTLLRRGLESFQSPDVLRFLGHKLPAHGGVHGKFAGEVVSDLKDRPEGMRLKHRAGRNTIKIYDKFGTVLRVETTLNDPKDFKVFRAKQDDPQGPKAWLPLRKSVADLTRRAALSEAANERYLEALADFDADTPLSKLADKLCRPIQQGTRRHRGLRPFDAQDVLLLETISRGEFELAGFRNRDIRRHLYGETENADERRKQAGRVSRQLAMLRAHGLIKKVPRTHRYLLTTRGRTAITALLAVRNANLKQLTAA